MNRFFNKSASVQAGIILELSVTKDTSWTYFLLKNIHMLAAEWNNAEHLEGCLSFPVVPCGPVTVTAKAFDDMQGLISHGKKRPSVAQRC